MVEYISLATVVLGLILAIVKFFTTYRSEEWGSTIQFGKSMKRIQSELSIAGDIKQNGYSELGNLIEKQIARKIVCIRARKETGFFSSPMTSAFLYYLFFIMVTLLLGFLLTLQTSIFNWILYYFAVALFSILFLILLMLALYSVSNFPDASRRYRARKARKSSRKEHLRLHCSAFIKYAESYTSYVLVDARSEKHRRVSPIVNCLNYSDELLRKISKLPLGTGIFVFSDFGKESYEIVHQLRERGFKDSYDLGEMKVWAPLLNRKMIELIGINHPPRELTKKKQGLHKH